MAQWQYRVVTFNSEYVTMADALVSHAVTGMDPGAKSCEIIQSRLNTEGIFGWELVSLLPAYPTISPPECQDISVANPWMYHAIFKRPKEEN